MEDFKEGLEDFKKVKDILNSDEERCLEKALDTGDQFWYRMFVRSFFAHVEGLAYKLQIQSLEWNKAKGLDKISKAEEAIINQENYSLNKGKVNKYPTFNSVDNSLRFAINIYTKVHNVEYELDLGADNRWNDFKDSIQIRNNITHPKEGDNLELTGGDVDTLMKAKNWFLENMTEMMDTVADKVWGEMGKTREEVKEMIEDQEEE